MAKRTGPPKSYRLAIVLLCLQLGIAGCATIPAAPSAVVPGESRALALASTVRQIPTTAEIRERGDLRSWAEEGLTHFGERDYEMAIPYFEAGIESPMAPWVLKTHLYWLASISYRHVGDRKGEVRSLEGFLMTVGSLDNGEEEVDWLFSDMSSSVSLARAKEVSRARLFGFRVERGQGFGLTEDGAIPIDSFFEEARVLSAYRCTRDEKDLLDLLDHSRYVATNGRTIEVFDVECTQSGKKFALFFDITTALQGSEEKETARDHATEKGAR